MSYVDAGYSVGLGTLFLYALVLLVRRRRLERRIMVSASDAESTARGEAAGDS